MGFSSAPVDKSQPDVSSPSTSAASMAMDASSAAQRRDSFPKVFSHGDVVVEEVGDEDLIDADARWAHPDATTYASYSSSDESGKNDDDSMHDDDNSTMENRLVLYRPPVRTSSANVAVFNAQLPPSHFVMKNRSDDWFVSRMSDAHKRHLAVVPYVGQSPPNKRRRDVYSHPVIHMPWTDKPSASSVAASAAVASTRTPSDDSEMVSDFGASAANQTDMDFSFNVPPAKRITVSHSPAIQQFPLGRQPHMEIFSSF